MNSIEKVLDFTTGNTIATSTYSSFGVLSKIGSTNSNRSFTNHQSDQDSTGLNYMNARYQSPGYGIFLSGDEATRGINSNSSLLSNPQALNAYSYTWNNPIMLWDPTGKLTVVIPGTWYKDGSWQSDGKLVQNASKTFGDTKFGTNLFVINDKSIWSGGDNKNARTKAANYIANLINNYTFGKDETLNIVAHSHGGSVAKEVSNMIDRRIDTLVTLGTPDRDDYTANESNIGKHIEVYSHDDIVQFMAGDYLKFGGPYASLLNQNADGFHLLQSSGAQFEMGPARRFENSGTTQIDATQYANSWNFFQNHSTLWQSDEIWAQVQSNL